MSSLLRSGIIVSSSTMLSRILGFIRDAMMAMYFGTGRVSDVFFIAFMIPNLMRRLVAEGALTVTFVPVYTDYLLRKGEKEALELSQKVFTLQSIIICAIIAIGILFSPQIMQIYFDNSTALSLSVDTLRIMFPYLLLVGFVAFSMGVLNSHKQFFAPAFAPVLLNVGMIIGIVFLQQFFSNGLYGVAVGVIIGGILQVFLQLPYLRRINFRFRISLDTKHPGVRKILLMMGPLMFATAVYQFNLLIMKYFARTIEDGSVSYIYYTDRLIELVLGIFIVTIGNIILPEMSRLSTEKDYSKLKSLFESSIKTVLFLTIPASVAFATIGKPIISVLFMRGIFDFSSVEMTDYSLFYATLGLSSIAILRVVAPTFYSMKDTKTPVWAAFIAFLVNITLGYFLKDTYLKHAGLTLANTLSITVQIIILIIILQKRIGSVDLGSIFKSLFKYSIASAVMFVTLNFLYDFADWSNDSIIKRGLILTLQISCGGSVYLITCYLLKVEEIIYFIQKIKGRISRQK